MPADRRRRMRGPAAAAIAAAMALLSACTGGSRPDHAGPARRLNLSGQILEWTGSTGTGFLTFSSSLATYSPDSGRTVTLFRRPSVFFNLAGGAAWGPDGTAYLMEARARTSVTGLTGRPTPDRQLFAIPPGGPPTRAGPPLLHGTLAGVSGGLAVASSCGKGRAAVSVLRLAHPEGWRTIASGCLAALAPDGRSVVYSSPDGSSVFEMPLAGGSPRQLVDLAALPGLAEAGISRPVVRTLAAGSPGVAAIAQQGSSGPTALVFAGSTASPRVVPLGVVVPGELAWQPGGDLLAFVDCFGCRGFPRQPRGEIRALDARSGRIVELAASDDAFSGLAWSPDGSVVASRWKQGELLFVDPARGETVRRPGDGSPAAWRA